VEQVLALDFRQRAQYQPNYEPFEALNALLLPVEQAHGALSGLAIPNRYFTLVCMFLCGPPFTLAFHA
jgi:hypothetical protein